MAMLCRCATVVLFSLQLC
uniref:Uncharacterized protein n=1 Tax=Arundo donax TaxID=35708 RepID=A0A0A8ZCF8_ARUDO